MNRIRSTIASRPPVPSMVEHHEEAMAQFEASRLERTETGLASPEVVTESPIEVLQRLQSEGSVLNILSVEGATVASLHGQSGEVCDVTGLLHPGIPILRVKAGNPYAGWSLQSVNADREKILVRAEDGGVTNFKASSFGHVDEHGNGWFFDTEALSKEASGN